MTASIMLHAAACAKECLPQQGNFEVLHVVQSWHTISFGQCMVWHT